VLANCAQLINAHINSTPPPPPSPPPHKHTHTDTHIHTHSLFTRRTLHVHTHKRTPPLQTCPLIYFKVARPTWVYFRPSDSKRGRRRSTDSAGGDGLEDYVQ
jgi:hypothetical protein